MLPHPSCVDTHFAQKLKETKENLDNIANIVKNLNLYRQKQYFR